MNLFKSQYSGNRSRKIWARINLLKGARREELYACFVLLQNMEGVCLSWLNAAIKEERKMFNKTETHLQRIILEYLKIKGYVAGKTKTVGIYDPTRKVFRYDAMQFRGFPDICCFTPELLFIECKSAKGKMSEEQEYFKGLCQKAAVKYIVARTLGDVMEEV